MMPDAGTPGRGVKSPRRNLAWVRFCRFHYIESVSRAGRLERFSRPGCVFSARPSQRVQRLLQSLGSDMSKYQVERPGHSGEIERIDEQPCISDLPAAAAAHEAPKLLLGGPSLPRRLLLQCAERSKVTLSVDDLFHGGGTQSADQLVLQICDAHVETQPFHLDASEVGAEAGSLETAPEVGLLSGVAKSRQGDVEPLRAEQIQEPSYGLRTPYRHNGNALSVKTPATALSERLEGALVADPFNEHDRTRVNACQVKSLRLVHARIFTATPGASGRGPEHPTRREP